MNAVNQTSFKTVDGRTIGPVVMEVKNITLRFGGVVAIKDISFDIREGEIRAIIGELGMGADPTSPRVPGSTAAHYAPLTPLSIVPAEQIDARSATLAGLGRRVGVLAWREPLTAQASVTWVSAAAQPQQAGAPATGGR